MASQEAAEYEVSCDYEELSLDYDDACNEVVELTAELHGSKMEVQQLRMRMQAARRKAATAGPHSKTGPTSLPAAVAVSPGEEQRAVEINGLLQWLAEHVDLGHVEIMEVGFEVPIGGRTVHLKRVAQWPLTTAPGGRLRLTAPIEHQDEISALLAAAKAHGKVEPQALKAFAAGWDMVAGELTTAQQARAEPSVLLANRGSTKGILVATWPTREALEAFHGNLHRADDNALRVGERVEVEYEGTWYSGVLHSVDASRNVNVKCDVDPPGVMTVTTMDCVRRAKPGAAANASSDLRAVQHVKVFSEEAKAAATTASAVGAPAAAAAAVVVPGPDRVRSHRRTRSSAL